MDCFLSFFLNLALSLELTVLPKHMDKGQRITNKDTRKSLAKMNLAL